VGILEEKLYATNILDCNDVISRTEMAAADVKNPPRKLVTIRR
jgi:hypothetical protein